ncbi:MAG TPA: methyltransferase domain-containing protein [Nocardioidaceae bacterium]|nr:methyltransferase domain-containing protein [Nocardioidaceae bacterium]
MSGHEHTPDVDWAEVVGQLQRGADVLRPVSEEVMDWLGVTDGGRVTDIGCGAGGMTALLAKGVGPSGTVYAVDGEQALLDATFERCRGLGYGDRVTTLRHDLSTGPPTIDRLQDLVWAAHVVHHLPDQQSAITELSGLLIEGGRLALSEGGLRTVTLPWDVGTGQPGLEARLHAAEEAWFVDMRASIRNSRRAPYGWPTLLRKAGLSDVRTRSFLLDRPSPISAHVAGFVIESLRHRVQRAEDRLEPDDLAAWAQLLDPDHEVYLGTRDDLFCLAAITVHLGVLRGSD